MTLADIEKLLASGEKIIEISSEVLEQLVAIVKIFEGDLLIDPKLVKAVTALKKLME